MPLWSIALFARARALDVVNTGWCGRDRCMAMGCSWIVRVLCSWRVASGGQGRQPLYNRIGEFVTRNVLWKMVSMRCCPVEPRTH